MKRKWREESLILSAAAVTVKKRLVHWVQAYQRSWAGWESNLTEKKRVVRCKVGNLWIYLSTQSNCIKKKTYFKCHFPLASCSIAFSKIVPNIPSMHDLFMWTPINRCIIVATVSKSKPTIRSPILIILSWLILQLFDLFLSKNEVRYFSPKHKMMSSNVHNQKILVFLL